MWQELLCGGRGKQRRRRLDVLHCRGLSRATCGVVVYAGYFRARGRAWVTWDCLSTCTEVVHILFAGLVQCTDESNRDFLAGLLSRAVIAASYRWTERMTLTCAKANAGVSLQFF